MDNGRLSAFLGFKPGVLGARPSCQNAKDADRALVIGDCDRMVATEDRMA